MKKNIGFKMFFRLFRQAAIYFFNEKINNYVINGIIVSSIDLIFISLIKIAKFTIFQILYDFYNHINIIYLLYFFLLTINEKKKLFIIQFEKITYLIMYLQILCCLFLIKMFLMIIKLYDNNYIIHIFNFYILNLLIIGMLADFIFGNFNIVIWIFKNILFHLNSKTINIFKIYILINLASYFIYLFF